MMNSNGNDLQLISKIVTKYVSHHRLATTQLPELINTVHQAMGQLGQPAQQKEERAPAVSVRQSVRNDHVVCLDCGFRGKTLRRHLSVRHGFSPDEYRQRWGLKRDHPLTAPAYSEQRSSMSKALGLGRRRAIRATVVKSEEAPAPVATAKPIRKARGTTKPAEASTPSKPARTRKPRRAALQAEQRASPAN
jgi:predicted transcriptional regulator